MGKSSSAIPITLGFLTVVEQPAVGHLGGFLVLNSRARPLEFHCTAPVQPSRAQEVLYGSTLKPYLYGEQIVTALVEKTKMRPTMFFTDLKEVIEARVENELRLSLVEASDVTSPSDGKNYRLDGAHGAGVSPPHFQSFRLGEYQVATHADFPDDARAVKELWKDHCDGLDLLEPFERIREAIHEAQRPAK